MTISKRALPNCAAVSGTVNRGVCSERLGAAEELSGAASTTVGPRFDAASSAGTRLRVPDQPVFEESSTSKCDGLRECRPRLVQNGKLKHESPLTPELKAFIDRVIAPILVRDFISEMQKEKQIAESGREAASCNSMSHASAVEVSR